MCSSTRAYQSKFTLKPQYLVYILLPKKHFLSHSLEAVLLYFKQRQNSNSFLSLSSSQTVYTGYSRMQMLKALERLKGLWVTTCGRCQGQEAGLRKEDSDCIGLERVWATQKRECKDFGKSGALHYVPWSVRLDIYPNFIASPQKLRHILWVAGAAGCLSISLPTLGYQGLC